MDGEVDREKPSDPAQWRLMNDGELAELETADEANTGDTVEARSAARSADARLCERLAENGFDGPLWEAYAEDLARYGLSVIRAWIANGEMFRQCEQRHRAVGPPPREMSPEDVNSLANEVVSLALIAFRERGLRHGKWNPKGGASLKTYFITACIYAFPNPFRRWRTEEAHWARTFVHDPVDASLLPGLAEPKNVAETVIARLDASSALAKVVDQRQLLILALRSQRYGWAEIAELTDLPSAGAARACHDRILAKLRKINEEGASEL